MNGKLASGRVTTDGKLANSTTFNNGMANWLDFTQITYGRHNLSIKPLYDRVDVWFEV